jgi:hypothetical protein
MAQPGLITQPAVPPTTAARRAPPAGASYPSSQRHRQEATRPRLHARLASPRRAATRPSAACDPEPPHAQSPDPRSTLCRFSSPLPIPLPVNGGNVDINGFEGRRFSPRLALSSPLLLYKAPGPFSPSLPVLSLSLTLSSLSLPAMCCLRSSPSLCAAHRGLTCRLLKLDLSAPTSQDPPCYRQASRLVPCSPRAPSPCSRRAQLATVKLIAGPSAPIRRSPELRPCLRTPYAICRHTLEPFPCSPSTISMPRLSSVHYR